jgi:hypothetical protein
VPSCYGPYNHRRVPAFVAPATGQSSGVVCHTALRAFRCPMCPQSFSSLDGGGPFLPQVCHAGAYFVNLIFVFVADPRRAAAPRTRAALQLWPIWPSSAVFQWAIFSRAAIDLKSSPAARGALHFRSRSSVTLGPAIRMAFVDRLSRPGGCSRCSLSASTLAPQVNTPRPGTAQFQSGVCGSPSSARLSPRARWLGYCASDARRHPCPHLSPPASMTG